MPITQQVLLPRQQEDVLDKLIKGLQIAQGVYGIKTAMEQSDLRKMQTNILKDETERKQLWNKLEDTGILTDKQMQDAGLVFYGKKGELVKSLGFKDESEATRLLPELDINMFPVVVARAKKLTSNSDNIDPDTGRKVSARRVPRELSDFDYIEGFAIDKKVLNSIFETFRKHREEKTTTKLKDRLDQAGLLGYVTPKEARDLIEIPEDFQAPSKSLVTPKKALLLKGFDDSGNPQSVPFNFITKDDYARIKGTNEDAIEKSIREAKEKVEREQKLFDKEKHLREEYNKPSKSTLEVLKAYKKIESATKNPNPTGVTAMAVVFAFNKLIDEGSVVREGEYDRAARIRPLKEFVDGVREMVESGAPITQQQMQRFMSEARFLMASQLGVQEQIDKRYLDLSNEYGVNPVHVLDPSFNETKKDLEREIGIMARPMEPTPFSNPLKTYDQKKSYLKQMLEKLKDQAMPRSGE